MMHIDTTPALPQLIDVQGVMKFTKLGRATIYRAVQAGELKPLKFGRRTLFTEAQISEWINSKVAA